MKELVIISGKGGTGKTIITASFLALNKKAVAADCDVDTPNLHLILNPVIKDEENYYGPKIAVLNKSKCIMCGKCMEEGICRFHAIEKGEMPVFNSFYCRGCRVCAYICPADAITLEERVCGKIYRGKTEYGEMVYGHLNPGQLGSGKMVVRIKNKMVEVAKGTMADLILVDSSAGMGCNVIASISGADFALIVTEPTLAGISDLKRIIELAEYFGIPFSVCINKCGINETNEKKIIDFCSSKGIRVAGKLPFDRKLTVKSNGEIPVIAEPESEFSKEVKKLWDEVVAGL